MFDFQDENGEPTVSQQQALAWLAEHNGSGIWDRFGALVAGGERAPVRRQTWNAVRERGWITFEPGTRIELTAAGVAIAKRKKFDPARDTRVQDEDAYK